MKKCEIDALYKETRKIGVEIEEYPGHCISKLVGSRYGAFLGLGDWGIILIAKELSNYKKTSVLFHEIGHFYCLKTRCWCNKTRTMRELHADEHALHELYSRELKHSLKYHIDTISSVLCHPQDYFAYYPKAASILVKKKIWQKCKDYLAA